ncbi:MAG: hypothetical protein AB7V27_06425 [Candidatus Binatia bacterium]
MPLTSAALAAIAGTHERYAGEWLEQQAPTGILRADNPAAAPLERRYALDPGHAEVLLDRDSLHHLMPLVRYFVSANI